MPTRDDNNAEPLGATTGAASKRDGGGPVGQAFVIQVALGAEPADGPLRGRVQHLATSDGENFDSAESLISNQRHELARKWRQEND